MSAILQALDKSSTIKNGEKGHIEFDWSFNIQERIVQLNFQLVRVNDSTKLENLRNELYGILSYLSELSTDDESRNLYLRLLYKMIGYTRDIKDGKGECTLTYMMIYTWYQFYPELACYAISLLVNENIKHPLGSWKDIKYLCKYCKEKSNSETHPIIRYCIFLMNNQLNIDQKQTEKTKLSLVAKWVPREKSSFGWMFDHLAFNFYREYIETAYTDNSKLLAKKKCKTHFRKLISDLNKKIETVQIHFCNNKWSSIDFKNVTSITLQKNKNAFLNITKGNEKRSSNKDREICSYNFKEFIRSKENSNSFLKGKKISMGQFTREARNILNEQIPTLNDENSIIKRKILNSQWNDNCELNNPLDKFIAMVDGSGSMDGNPMDTAVALGIRIAEKSKLGKRILTFSSKPNWVNLDECTDFVSCVQTTLCSEFGQNANFYASLNLILDAISESKLSYSEVNDLTLVILSDMQIDQADSEYGRYKNDSMINNIENKFKELGINKFGFPLKAPHIILWNLRNTNGFPCFSQNKDISMLSGSNPSLLNMFCESGLPALKSFSPWSNLIKALNNKRYDTFDITFNDSL
jgi:hypothetical protein